MGLKLASAPELWTSTVPDEKLRGRAPMASDSTDVQLIALVLAGESYRFQDLVDPYSERLYRMALVIVRNQSDAEDVVQESFLKAFLNLAKFRFDARFGTWLTSIALNEAKALLRARRHIAYEPIDTCSEVDENSFVELVCKQPLPFDAFENSEFRGLVARALRGLHPTYREIYDLREVEEFNTEMAAERLGIPIPLAKTRLHRARKMLHQRLTIMMSPKQRTTPGSTSVLHA
jgi:RNA polymerase sigma-70 factor (ECF subfamily)